MSVYEQFVMLQCECQGSLHVLLHLTRYVTLCHLGVYAHLLETPTCRQQLLHCEA